MIKGRDKSTGGKCFIAGDKVLNDLEKPAPEKGRRGEHAASRGSGGILTLEKKTAAKSGSQQVGHATSDSSKEKHQEKNTSINTR